MTTTPTTRYSWINLCAHRYIERLGLDATDAMACASACATAQDDEFGGRSTQWGDPGDVADADIECWEPA